MASRRHSVNLILRFGFALSILAAILRFGVDPASAADPRCAFSDRYPVEISVLGDADARAVVGLGLDVDAVRLPEGPMMPGVVTAYINDGEKARLTGLGYAVRQIPNEANERAEEIARKAALRAELDRGGKTATDEVEDWPTIAEFQTDLQAVAAAHPDICRLQSLGNSVQGRPLWIMKITSNAGVEGNKPEFKFSSTIHGNEPVGMELCRRMIHYLTDNYGTDPRVTNLVNSVEIWIAPLHNPDGYVAHTRYNAHGVDLNRDFPDPITDPHDDPTGREPEVQAYMNFGYAHNFILSTNYHTGALVINIPWDCQYAHIPDYDLTWSIGSGYAYRNPPLWSGSGGIGTHGVVVGAEWYVVHGGMQDWCYNWRNEIDITMEVSQTMWPVWSQMDSLWNDNRDAMLYYMEQTLTGVHGTVTDALTGLPLSASVNVLQYNKPILSDPDLGDYHRMLLPGTYTVEFDKTGYVSQVFTNVVVTSLTATELDAALTRVPSATPGAAASGEAAAAMSLSAPRPNPVIGVSTHPVELELVLRAPAFVRAGVFDALGREVCDLATGGAGPIGAGRHVLVWNGRIEGGSEAAPGVYWIRVTADGRSVARKISVVR